MTAVAGQPWTERLRRCSELRRHWRAAFALACALAFVLLAKAFLQDRLILNRTASIPRGVYWLSRGAAPERGELVAFPIPEHVRALFRERKLVPSAFFSLLSKPVAAVSGDHVCIRDERVFINEQLIATVSRVDSRGRDMPIAALCRELADEVFVLTDGASFDSRYLGPIPKTDVVGTLTPLLEL
jgi:conjugative transfer signal peptidase TraF